MTVSDRPEPSRHDRVDVRPAPLDRVASLTANAAAGAESSTAAPPAST